MRHHLTPLALAALLAVACPAHALWPTTVAENLPVSANPAFSERYPTALPFGDGSTFVAFLHVQYPYSNRYQIINQYGELLFAEPLSFAPAMPDNHIYYPHIIADGLGGVIAAWYISESSINEGFHAQRVDSMGNILWGNSGVELFPSMPFPTAWDLCPDGSGGCFIAASFQSDVWLQHVDAQGGLPWDQGAYKFTLTPTRKGIPSWPPMRKAAATSPGRTGAHPSPNAPI